MSPSDACSRIHDMAMSQQGAGSTQTSEAAAIGHRGALTMRLALVEIATRESEGSPTRMLALDALKAAGYVIDTPPPEGRQVTLDDYMEKAHG